MKTFSYFALSFILAGAVLAQGSLGTIKVTTKLRPDGSTATRMVDPEKRTIEESLNDSSGKLISKTVFNTDERNIAVGATHFDAKGKVRYKEIYKIDSADRIAESTLLSATDQPLGRRVFNYDSKGNARIDDYDASGRLVAPATAASTSRGRPDKPTVRRALPAR